jgi:hypothetical protein
MIFRAHCNLFCRAKRVGPNGAEVTNLMREACLRRFGFANLVPARPDDTVHQDISAHYQYRPA